MLVTPFCSKCNSISSAIRFDLQDNEAVHMSPTGNINFIVYKLSLGLLLRLTERMYARILKLDYGFIFEIKTRLLLFLDLFSCYFFQAGKCASNKVPSIDYIRDKEGKKNDMQIRDY